MEKDLLGPLTGQILAVLASVASITVALLGRRPWLPPEHEIPKLVRQIAAGIGAVVIVWLWIRAQQGSAYTGLLEEVAFTAITIATIALLIYLLLMWVYIFEGSRTDGQDPRIVGGIWLTREAKSAKGSQRTIQQVLESLSFNPDRVWPRESRAATKCLISLTLLGLFAAGPVGIASIGLAAVSFREAIPAQGVPELTADTAEKIAPEAPTTGVQGTEVSVDLAGQPGEPRKRTIDSETFVIACLPEDGRQRSGCTQALLASVLRGASEEVQHALNRPILMTSFDKNYDVDGFDIPEGWHVAGFRDARCSHYNVGNTGLQVHFPHMDIVGVSSGGNLTLTTNGYHLGEINEKWPDPKDWSLVFRCSAELQIVKGDT